jgi:hypothetical protein
VPLGVRAHSEALRPAPMWVRPIISYIYAAGRRASFAHSAYEKSPRFANPFAIDCGIRVQLAYAWSHSIEIISRALRARVSEKVKSAHFFATRHRFRIIKLTILMYFVLKRRRAHSCALGCNAGCALPRRTI